MRSTILAAAITSLVACGSKPKPTIEEPEKSGPLSAAEKLAELIRASESVWWAKDGACQKWDLEVEIDDDEGILGIARRTVDDGDRKRTVAYKLSVATDGAISALGPTMTITSSLGKTSGGGSASCSNRFKVAADIEGGVRLTSRVDGGDQVLDERWYFSAEACEAGRGAPVTSGCGR